jgi:hypothetical protein
MITIHNVEITSKYRNDQLTPMFLHWVLMEKQMSKLGIVGATALSLALAVATPALAEGRGGGGGGGMHGGGGGMHVGGGGGMPVGGGRFRGAQESVGAGRVGSVSGNLAQRGGGGFAQGGYRGGYGRGVGFGAGLAAGSALGYGYGGDYDPYNYSDDYAYNDPGYDGYPGYDGDPGYVVSSGVDPSYCAQRYQSYDPASGTYLAYDGLRHPCS